MSHNTIGLLKANGQIEEYGNTGGGASDSSFIGTHAEWNALTAEQKALYEIVNFTDDSATPDVVDSVPTQNSTHLVSSNGVWNVVRQVQGNFGTVEPSNIALYPHSVYEAFIFNGQFVMATSAIAIGDTIAYGSNIDYYNVASNTNLIFKNKQYSLGYISPRSEITCYIPDTIYNHLGVYIVSVGNDYGVGSAWLVMAANAISSMVVTNLIDGGYFTFTKIDNRSFKIGTTMQADGQVSIVSIGI